MTYLERISDFTDEDIVFQVGVRFSSLLKYCWSIYGPWFLKTIGINGFNPRLWPSGSQVIYDTCGDGSLTQGVCSRFFRFAYGNDGVLFNKTLLPELLRLTLAGASVKTMYHFLQIFNTGKFQLPDDGKTITQRDYNLTEVSAPVSIHYAYNDVLADREGVIALSKHLKHVVKTVRLPDDRLNHLGFLCSVNITANVYRDVLNVLSEF